MNVIFLEVINNSITASYLIVAVIILRLLLKKIPKWSVCLLWAMVALRLMMPFEIESRFSLLPKAGLMRAEEQKNIEPVEQNQKDEIWEQYIQEQYSLQQQNKDQQINQINEGDDTFVIDENGSMESYSVVSFRKEAMNQLGNIAFYFWLAGSFGLIIYAVLSFLGLKRKVAASILLYDNVFLCDEIESPFVMGIFKPCIYLSSKTPKKVWDSIFVHENAHIKRGDHIWKLIGYVLLVIYWFNPLSWTAYILFCKDIELACDEKATKDMNQRQRADYCQALLECSMNRKTAIVCPVAFGEVGVKERIKQILNYKNPSFWMILVAVMVCIIVSVCFMTNPTSKEEGDGAISETTEASSEQKLEVSGPGSGENATEYDHKEADIYGYRWLSNEIFVYEFEDLDQNGVEEYVKVWHAENEPEYFCRFTFYWNGEAIYEYDDPCRISPGDAEYLDLDGDGQKEIFFPFYPAVNSMPLEEYIVLKQKADMSWEPLEMIHGDEMWQNAFPISITKGDNEWEAVISCEGLEKKIVFDIKNYYLYLKEIWEKDESEARDYWMRIISDYKRGFPEESEWYTFGNVCSWGIWEIESGEYQGQPCLIATHGIQGYDKFDLWGELDVYFNYDAQGKTRFLDMEFLMAGTTSEFTMEYLIALCDAGGDELESALSDFNRDGELPYSNFEKKVYEYDWSYFCYLPYEGREYRLQVSYELSDHYGFKPNELMRVNLYCLDTKDIQLLYENEERFPYDPPIYNLDIRSFLLNDLGL